MLKEFREFLMRGNVVDLAVGVIIGGAFGKIITSLVDDMLMPGIGMAMGKVDFKELKVVLQQAVTGADGKETAPEVAIRWGMFLNSIIQFVIIGFCIFMVIKGINKAFVKNKEDEIAAGPTETDLLEEIRDLLKAK